MRHDAPHQLAHIVEVHQHAAVLVAVFRRPLVVVRVTAAAVMVAEVKQKSQQQARHHRFGHAHQVRRDGSFVCAVVDPMVAAESFSLHHRRIAAVAGTTGLRQEHVEVVVLVVAPLETVATDGHAWRGSTCATPISDNVRHPDKTALGVIIVATNCNGNERNCQSLQHANEIWR